MPSKKRTKKVSKKTIPPTPFFAESVLATMTSDMPFSLKKKKVRSDSRQRAQDFFYRAMECDSSDEQHQLLKQVLELDPDHVDAATALLRHEDTGAGKRIEILRVILERAADQLGDEGFQEYEGQFWGFLETRPYMRARQALAAELHAAGHLEESVTEYEGMIKLNPNDNQGVRFELMGNYLELNRLKDAQRLLKKYKDDCDYNVVFAWSRVLERLLSEDEVSAVKTLASARKQNPHMETYLKGYRKVPKKMPWSYSPGSKEEAICYARPLLKSWRAHPQAQAWLLKQP